MTPRLALARGEAWFLLAPRRPSRPYRRQGDPLTGEDRRERVAAKEAPRLHPESGHTLTFRRMFRAMRNTRGRVIQTGHSLPLSFQATIAVACGLLLLASTTVRATATPAPGGCKSFVYKGDYWQESVRGVSCAFANGWFPKMYAAHSQLGGKWNGPAGWICIKVQRDPGYVERGVCGTHTQKEMAWLNFFHRP
jgi:hypothetical protein